MWRSPLRTISWSSASRIRTSPSFLRSLGSRERERFPPRLLFREIMAPRVLWILGIAIRPEIPQERLNTVQVVNDRGAGHGGSNHRPEPEYGADQIIRQMIRVRPRANLPPPPCVRACRPHQGAQVVEEVRDNSFDGRHMGRDLRRSQAHQTPKTVRRCWQIAKLLKEGLDLSEAGARMVDGREPPGDVGPAIALQNHLEELPLVPESAIDPGAIQARTRPECF